jgi:Spy/CpxP family protein refolding chaperone
MLGALTAGGVALGAGSSGAAPAADASGPDGMGGPGGPARRLGRILDKVNATPAQRSQIQAIWQGLRPQLKTARQQHEAIRQQIVTALSAQTIDPSAVEKLRQQGMTWADKTSSLFTQGMVQTAQVLTPDQRKLAAQEFEQHHAHGPHGFGPPAP